MAITLSFALSSCLGGLELVALGAVANAVKAGKDRRAAEANKQPELTQLQLRQLQTRTYEESDKAKIVQVALAVLQDDGFNVTNANMDLGLLSADKQKTDTKVDSAGAAFAKGLFGRTSLPSTDYSSIKATLTVTPFGDENRVRMAFSLSESGSGSQPVQTALTVPEPYREFFTKLEKGLFIEREGL